MKTNKMNCKILHKNIFKYLEKELAENVYKGMQQHLDSCEDCQNLVSKLKNTNETILNEKITESDPFFYTRLEARMERGHSELYETKHKLIPALKYAIASMVIILSLLSGTMLGLGFRNNYSQVSEDNISYADSYTNDYYLFEMEDEVIENVLLNQ